MNCINIYNDICNNFYVLNNNIYNIDKNIIGIIENIKDIFYKITWYNNTIKEEYYFSFDCINYYKDVEKYILLLEDKIEYINVKNNSWNEICILNHIDSKIYRKNNYCDCGDFYYENNNLIVNWEKYGSEKFYISNSNKIYYSNTYFEENFKKIFIIDKNEYFYYNAKDNYLYSFDLNNILYNVKNVNENLILYKFIDDSYSINNNNQILYFIENNKYTYDRKLYVYGNKELKLLDNDLKLINNNNLKLNYLEEYTLNKNYETYINYKKKCINDNFRENDKIIFMFIDNIIDNSIFLDILNKVDYLQIHYNYKIIIFDNICNKNKYDKSYNKCYSIIYYFNIDKTLNYLFNNDNFIQKYDIFYIYTKNYNYFNHKIRNNRLIFYDKYDINLFSNVINSKYTTIKDYYQKNHKNILNISKNDSNRNNIPKIIHFIWIGNNIPEKYLEYIETWIRYHTDYYFCFWNNNNIPKLVNQELFDNATDYAMKVDILRYEIIYFLGGIYIDCDFLCIKNIDDLINNLDNFCSRESKEFITNAIFGFVRENDFLYNVIENLNYNFFTYKNVINNNLYIPKITGPEYFTELCNIFQKNNGLNELNKLNGLNVFDTEIFYSYTFQNKFHNNNVIIKKENYGIHMWGNSWNIENIKVNENNDKINNDINYVEKLILTNKIKSINDIECCKNTLFKKSNNKKKLVVHIIGIFFSGGIEKLMYYFNKYGSKYNYIILCHGFSNKNYYNVDNIISFDGNQVLLNKYLHLANPDLIIDHYSIYVENNDIMYKNINKNNVIQFMHSAILYKKDISIYNIKKCIHLYKEEDSLKHNSWNKVGDNYYTTLGTEIVSSNASDVNDNNNSKINSKKIIISIIGRIAEEKIPLDFLQGLSDFSISNNKKFVINIYGEKDYLFSIDYLDKFNKIIYSSNINYMGFMDSQSIYKNTHILLIPSLYETGSFVCLEAFVHGIPVIARNCYGLKHLINNDNTGFLFNNNQECFNIISNITKKKLNVMKKNIIKESLKYNIIDKIKDIEYIIDENIKCKNNGYKNIFIITSVLNCTNLELSYSKKRTVFSFNSRYRQTIKTIQSIRKYYSDCHILLCDCSDLSNYKNKELEISKLVDYYYNFYDDNSIKDAVNGKYKGYGECMLLLKALEIINNLNESYKYIFKISGRYYLNDNFDNKVFENNENVFTTWDGCNFSLCTVLYKLMYNDRTYFEEILKKSINELLENNSIEICIYKYFLKNINIVEKINVDGFLSTEGYKCSF